MAKRIPIPFHNHTKSSIPSLLSKHSKLSPSFIKQVQAASHVYPFRANNYVVDELIDWNNVPNDPIFKLTFPQPQMLFDSDMERVIKLMDEGDDTPASREAIRREAIQIRKDLNPHPAKQKEMNVPVVDGTRLGGAQHKYRETLLFFPSEAQWCHSYCTYCFRWAQFTEVGSEQQFKSKDIEKLQKYIKNNKQLTDILFTGGDPAVMKTKIWQKYLEPIVDEKNAKDFEHLSTIRIGTKSLTYWPYRYTHNDDADEFLTLLEKCTKAGKHVTIQAHFTHPQELSTPQVEDAIRRLRMTGANIRSQAPIIKGINDDASIWEEMWKKQISLGIIPYYMFVERDTGPKHYFELPLIKAYQVFKEAVSRVSGVARTVRGPSMSCEPGKVAVMGIINDMMILQFLQARDPEWMKNPFLAKYDPTATWLDDLKPYDGSESFFYQKELDEMINIGMSSGQMNDDIINKHFNQQQTLTDNKKVKLSSIPNGNALKMNGNSNHSNGHHINGKNGINGHHHHQHINGKNKNNKQMKPDLFITHQQNQQKQI
mmetsp:Transcript_56726/g.51044  ORF Transcript_56726/g.51044 Transcript_56726/m.51044 type:complete len:541 (+) Transcript_56726:218-1840(+)